MNKSSRRMFLWCVVSVAMLALALQTLPSAKPSHIESLMFVSDMSGNCELITSGPITLASGSYVVHEFHSINSEPMSCFVVVAMTGSYYAVLSETVRDIKNQLPVESTLIQLNAKEYEQKYG